MPDDFFQNYFFFEKISFKNTTRVSNSLGPDQARCLFGPDLVPNCLKRLSADGKSHGYQGKECLMVNKKCHGVVMYLKY